MCVVFPVLLCGLQAARDGRRVAGAGRGRERRGDGARTQSATGAPGAAAPAERDARPLRAARERARLLDPRARRHQEGHVLLYTSNYFFAYTVQRRSLALYSLVITVVQVCMSLMFSLSVFLALTLTHVLFIYDTFGLGAPTCFSIPPRKVLASMVLEAVSPGALFSASCLLADPLAP